MIEINNLSRTFFNKNILKRTARIVLKGEGKEKRSLSLALVGEKRIRELNKKYLSRDYSTDVLSFPDRDSGDYLGEVIICPIYVKENAGKDSFHEEMIKVLIHGILHLFGYDHEGKKTEQARMEKKGHQYFKKILKQ